MCSYYILQIIQEDKGSGCYVFRKWGRIGNEKIGGNKLEEMTKSDAIQEFKRLFLEKTGNPWEAWQKKENFEKQPGRFFPLEIVCSSNSSSFNFENSRCKLDLCCGMCIVHYSFRFHSFCTMFQSIDTSARQVRHGWECLQNLANWKILGSSQSIICPPFFAIHICILLSIVCFIR